MEWVKELKNPIYTAKFQQMCGVYYSRRPDDNRTTYSNGRGSVLQPVDAKFAEGRFQQVNCGNFKDLDNNNALKRANGLNFKNGYVKNCVEKSKINGTVDTHDEKAQSNYVIKYRLLYYFFSLASSLGNEAFYLMFYPFCLWNVDAVLIRRVALVWCVCMYVGQALKDKLRWPRPSAPPVVKLETFYLQEFAMPSTHAMSATAIPVMSALVILERYEVPMIPVILVAVLWLVIVSASRLYLGVHSFLDILVGIVLSLLIIGVMVPYIGDLDMYQQTNPMSPVISFMISLLMCTILYPDKKHGVSFYSTKGDAVQIVAVLAGVSFGSWANFYFGFTNMAEPSLPFTVALPTWRILALSVVRFFIGTVILTLIRFILAPPTVRFFSYMHGLEKADKRHPNVETGYKYVIFYTLGVAISFLVPFAHCMFGFDRASFFSEVL